MLFCGWEHVFLESCACEGSSPSRQKEVIALIFVVPAVLAGFYATLGITKTMMPSETWQMIFAVIGAGAVGVSAFLRIAGMAADTSDGSAVGA